MANHEIYYKSIIDNGYIKYDGWKYYINFLEDFKKWEEITDRNMILYINDCIFKTKSIIKLSQDDIFLECI